MQKFNLNDAHVLAASRGGECLSTEYLNNYTPLRWRCARRHEWEAALNDVKNKRRWCKKCDQMERQCGLDEMRQIAALRGGECLSTEYVNNSTPLQWRCRNGHEWPATPKSIKNLDSWCRICSNKAAGEARRGKKRGPNSNVRATLEEMEDLATLRGGKCLSDEYVNAHTHLWWRCAKGHEWPAMPANVKNGTWCPDCALEEIRLGLSAMKALAESRGGECLSTEYVNVYTHLQWRCAKGHEWNATPHTVSNNSRWCPTCALEETRLELLEMQLLAALRGGECLSTEYVNADTHLQWRCAKGHEWPAKPNNVKNRRQWCPVCNPGGAPRHS